MLKNKACPLLLAVIVLAAPAAARAGISAEVPYTDGCDPGGSLCEQSVPPPFQLSVPVTCQAPSGPACCDAQGFCAPETCAVAAGFHDSSTVGFDFQPDSHHCCTALQRPCDEASELANEIGASGGSIPPDAECLELFFGVLFLAEDQFGPGCTFFCGDGFLDDLFEECDDGNNVNGDGCSAICTVEPSDADGDGIADAIDNCPFVANGDAEATGIPTWGQQAESAQSPGTGCACLCGDPNRDCVVNVGDAPEAQRAGLFPPLPPLSPNFDIDFCDINSDDLCNVGDAPEMQRAGLFPPLPPLSPNFSVTACSGYLGLAFDTGWSHTCTIDCLNVETEGRESITRTGRNVDGSAVCKTGRLVCKSGRSAACVNAANEAEKEPLYDDCTSGALGNCTRGCLIP